MATTAVEPTLMMTDADALLLIEDPTASEKTEKLPNMSEQPPTRRQRNLQRLLWTSICCTFAVVYPVGILILLIFNAPFYLDVDSCGTRSMSAQSLLAPDTLFGDFTVTQARAIDLSWNLAMGRLVPFLMALVFFKVASMALVKLAETRGVNYQLFATISLGLHSIWAVGPLTKAAIRTAGWKAKAAVLFMLYSVILVLLMPTLMDLQTGYVRKQAAGYRFDNGTIVLASTVTCGPSSGADPVNGQGTVCRVDDAVSAAVGNVCVDGAAYQWGFSAIWFLITHTLAGIWAGGLYIIWFYTSRKSMLVRAGRDMGMWRAILDIAHALKEDLGDGLDMIAEKELKKRVEKCSPIKYDVQKDDGGRPQRVVLVAASIKLA